MKIKKLAALALSCAMVVAGGAMFAACGDEKDPDKDTGFVEDTRIWYAIGKDTKGTLKDLGWDDNTNSKYAFTKDTTKTDENVFTLSLDIYAGNVSIGNSFKFLYKETADEKNVPWTRQVGMQHLAGKEGTDADTVLKMDGETVFWTEADNGSYNNIALAKGQEGRYKFTLKTESNTDMNPVITVEKESTIAVNYDMYVIGDINNFGVSKLEMTENIVEGSATTWVCKLKVTANDLYRDAEGAIVADEESGEAAGQYAAVCILNERDGKMFVPEAGEGVILKKVKNFTGNKEYDCVLLEEGTYTVTFTEVKTDTEFGGSVTVAESAFEMYLIGTINSWNEETACTPEYAMTEQADGSWTATLTVTKDEMIKTFNKKGLPNEKYSAGSDVALTAGTWAIKYDPETNTFKAEKYGYYLVGTFMDGEDTVNFAIKAGVTPALEAGATEGEMTVTYDFKDVSAQYDWMGAGNIAAVKVVWGTEICGVANSDWYGDATNNANVMITSVGEWTITFDLTSKRITGAVKA
ncbi:MAG: hypothetical protein HFK05_00285 [Clostridia bacterium]|nr:hypothetical protein [Clostridia bacterium]